MIHRLALTLLFMVSAVGCSGGDDAEFITTPPTIKPGRLVACTNTPYEPFEYRVDGQLKGIDVDLLMAAAETMDLQVEFREVEFESIFQELEARNCDLVASGVSITPERQAKYAFSAGYFEVSQSLAVRSSDRTRYRDLDDLAGARIGVQKATTGADYVAKRLPGTPVVEYVDSEALVDALAAGEVDAAVQDSPINSVAARKDTNLVVTKTFTDVEREQYGFVMDQNAGQLRESLDQAIERLRRNGQYDEILARYLGPTR